MTAAHELSAPLVQWEAVDAAGGELLSPATRHALEQAAVDAGEAWDRSPDGGGAVAEVRALLTTLCTAVALAAAGVADPTHQPALGGLDPRLPVRRLLDAVRRGFLEQSRRREASIDPSEALRVLAAVDRVERTLERDLALRFVDRLSGADALDLLIEVAHDMRSPLGSILFLAERLRKGQSGPVTPIQERQLGLVYSAAFGLSSLASDVIELARGGDRLVDRHPMPFAVSEILAQVRSIVLPIAEEKGLTLQLSGPEVDHRVGQPAALNRVLLNLTTNALKFTAEGSVTVTARQRSASRVEFTVSDTGRGIPPRVMATLFEPFRRRAKPGDYAFSSAGLGLSICQKLVAAMGGELRVETELEKGTRFSFEIDLPAAMRL